MRSVVGFLALGWSTVAFSQSKEYYDRQGEKCPPSSSTYYSIRQKRQTSFSFDTVQYYYTHSHHLMSIGLQDLSGNRMGLHESFYENGRVKSKRRYEVKRNTAADAALDSIDCTIMEFNDSLGHSTVQNGEGRVDGRLDFLVEHGKVVNGQRDSVWTVHYENGKVYCYESWHMGQLVDGISYGPDGKEYYYQRVLVPPEPVGGFQEFFRQASGKIIYPKDAQRRSIEGKVLVEVMIGKAGTVALPRIVKGIGFGCDEEALKAVAASPPWVPCQLRGQFIDYEIIIPIVFKLK